MTGEMMWEAYCRTTNTNCNTRHDIWKFCGGGAAAIVYKASWPDEKVCRCTVGTLAETAKEHNITKTALITVGNFLGNIYDRSELYNPTFAHGYRAADPSKLDLKPEVK